MPGWECFDCGDSIQTDDMELFARVAGNHQCSKPDGDVIVHNPDWNQ